MKIECFNVSVGSWRGEDALWFGTDWLFWRVEVRSETSLDVSVVVFQGKVRKLKETEEFAWNCDWRFSQKSINWWKSFHEDLVY